MYAKSESLLCHLPPDFKWYIDDVEKKKIWGRRIIVSDC